MAMELSQEQSHNKFPSLKHIAAKHLLDNNVHNHPCDHIDQLLAHEELCEDLHNDLKNEFRKKHRGYGFNEGFKSKKIYANGYAKKLALKDDGTNVYMLGKKGIKEFDIHSGAMLNSLDEDTDNLNNLIYNKGFLIAGTGDGTIKLWNGHDNECIHIIDNKEKIQTLATDNTNIFCSTSSEKVKIWDMASGSCLKETIIPNKSHRYYPCILNNDVLYTINNDNTIAYDICSDKQTSLFPSKDMRTFAVSSQFPFSFFSGGINSKLQEWDKRNFIKPVHTIKTIFTVDKIITQGNALYVALAADLSTKKCTIQVFNKQQDGLDHITTLPDEGFHIYDMHINNTGLYVASTKGLTALTAKSSYDNVYKILKDITFKQT